MIGNKDQWEQSDPTAPITF